MTRTGTARILSTLLFARSGSRGLIVSLLLAGSVQCMEAGDALSLFKNYFVTGDYVVGGVGVRGQGAKDPAAKAITGTSNNLYATGTIQITGVPQGADIVAAYLYWDTIAPAGSDATTLEAGIFQGNKILGKPIQPTGANAPPACYGSGGGNGQGGVNHAQSLLV